MLSRPRIDRALETRIDVLADEQKLVDFPFQLFPRRDLIFSISPEDEPLEQDPQTVLVCGQDRRVEPLAVFVVKVRSRQLASDLLEPRINWHRGSPLP